MSQAPSVLGADSGFDARARRDVAPARASPSSSLDSTAVLDRGEDKLVNTGVLVVGGGPAGYTTAIALAQRGFQDIIVLERSESAGYFDARKQFVYNVSPIGRRVLVDFGVPPLDGVPASNMKVKYLMPDGSVKDKLAFGKERDPSLESTWIPRNMLNEHLFQHAVDAHGDSVKVVMNAHVTNISIPANSRDPVVVEASVKSQDGEQEAVRYTARLVVGADGAASIVRKSLEARQPNTGWERPELVSDSSGLAFKVLPLPANPVLSDAGGQLINSRSVIIPGSAVNGDFPLKLGLLNMKATLQQRTANIILWPSHNFWQIKSIDEWYNYMEQAFPQLDYLRDAVPPDEVQAFMDTPLATFKAPQACSRLLAELPSAAPAATAAGDLAGEIEGCALCLVGDAAHVFPPDLGQGVNAAILDVGALANRFADCPSSPSAALRAYEAGRIPEHQALVRLVQIGFPYQYKQAGTKVKQFLWTLNAGVRQLLSLILPWFFSPAVVVPFITGKAGIDNWETMYQDVMNAGDRTTRNLRVLLAIIIVVAAALTFQPK